MKTTDFVRTWVVGRAARRADGGLVRGRAGDTGDAVKELANFAVSMYAHEPCRICGVMITELDLQDLVFAGYSKDNEARSAHGSCWTKRGEDNPETWSYP